MEQKVPIDVGAGVDPRGERNVAHRLAVLAPDSFIAIAAVFLRFFSKNPILQKAVAALVQAASRPQISKCRAISNALGLGPAPRATLLMRRRRCVLLDHVHN